MVPVIPQQPSVTTSRPLSGTNVLALLPFLVDKALPLRVLRDMRRRGMQVVIAYYLDEAVGLPRDPCLDFERDGCLVDMTRWKWSGGVDKLETIVDRHEIQLVIQIGSTWAYSQLPALKERRPDLRLVDWLFNTGPHFTSFAYRSGCFDGCLVESATMMRSAETLPGVGAIRKVENGVDLSVFVPRGRAVTWPSGDLVVGFVGRMSPEKNPLGFVEMAERVVAQEPSARFSIYGSGVQADEVQRRIGASPARDSIRYVGYVEHPTDAYADIDVLVVPSLMDGRPNSVMEASACGIPVIGAPVGGIPELISEGLNGYLIPPTETAEIAGLLAAWRGNPGAFRDLRSSSRALAEQLFDRDRMMDGYAEALAQWALTPARPLPCVAARTTPLSLTIRDGNDCGRGSQDGVM